jgi:O-antigen ligase
LTDRTKIWSDCLKLVNNPLLGTGFESFWLGYRLEILWAKWFWHPNQAHNGYIETYLNLGAVGVFILLGLLIATFRKISADLEKNFDFARIQMGFFFAIIFFNYAEAVFKGVAFIWTIFFIIAIDNPIQPIEQIKVQADKIVVRPRQFRYKRTLEKGLDNATQNK